MSKAAMNLQDSFLNQIRRENSEVRVLLVNGTLLRGSVKGFDNFTLILNNRNGQHLIYKHAVAQIVTHRPHVKIDDLHTGEDSGDTEQPELLSSSEDSIKDETSEHPAIPVSEKAPDGDKPRSNAPQGERPARTTVPQGERPPRTNLPQGDRPARTNAPQGERPSRQRAPQGDRPPRPVAPQNADRSPRPNPAPKPKKEGFNTLDLSSVKLGDSK